MELSTGRMINCGDKMSGMLKLKLPIHTNFWPKPVYTKEFDWSAVDDNYEPGCPIGYGATEEEAIADLMGQFDESD